MARSAGSKISELIPLSGGVLVGTFVPRALTQMLLGANNSGIQGYGAQLLISAILGYLGTKALSNKQFGSGIIAGGVAATAYRVYQEKNPSTPTAIVQAASGASAMNGLGDLDFSDNGLGTYVNQPFSFPQTLQFTNGNLSPVPGVGPTNGAPALPVVAAAGSGQELDRYSRY